MKNEKKALFFLYLAISLIATSVIWDLIIAIQCWDIVLTPHQKFLFYWKPTAILFTGIVSMYVSQELINR